MADIQVAPVAFRLLAESTAASAAARFAARNMSPDHFQNAHALFEESATACEDTIDIAIGLLREYGAYASLSPVELSSATPTLRVFRPSDPGDAATAIRSAHSCLAEILTELQGAVNGASFAPVSAAAIRHSSLAGALAQTQATPIIGAPSR